MKISCLNNSIVLLRDYKMLVPSDLNKPIHFYDEVCVMIFVIKLKGITTEGTEALRATQSKD